MSIDSVEIGGSPAGVLSAVLVLEYADGNLEERTLNFRPNGLMYEVFLEQVEALQRLL